MDVDDIVRMRLLRGELPSGEAEALRRRAAGDPVLAAELARLEGVWQAIGPDSSALPRPGFATAVMARARAEGKPGSAVSWAYAPLWAKAAAVVALAVGVALGSSLMSLGTESQASAATATSQSSQVAQVTPTLAEDYADALQGSLADDTTSGTEARQ